MFARVSLIQGNPQQLEEGIRHYRENMLPEARQLTGFRGAMLMVDRKSGKNLGITFWDTEKNLQASTAAADKLRTQAANQIASSGLPVVETYEVVVQEIGSPETASI